MPHAVSLLVSRERDLADQVQDVVDRVRHLDLVLAPNAEAAVDLLDRPEVALVLVHVPARVNEALVGRILDAVKAAGLDLPVIALCDQLVPELMLALFRLGVADCLPSLDRSRLEYNLNAHTVAKRFTLKNAAPANDSAELEMLGAKGQYFFRPDDMGRILDDVRQIAPQDTAILLTGETGTGKTQLARLIHELSGRKDLPFYEAHCGTFQQNLIESELFGHVRGAFTGADRDHIGALEEAGRGTLFLDDIDALPLTGQVKLLQALDQRIFRRVGQSSATMLPLQARLIVASHVDLEAKIKAGEFRDDLYYRLNVVSFHLAPLRERKGLIGPLARKFIPEFAARNQRPVRDLAPEAIEVLEAYPWPGNIRELKNALEHGVALCRGSRLRPEDLPERIRREAQAALSAALSAECVLPGSLHETVANEGSSMEISSLSGKLADIREQAERQRLREALAHNGGDKTATARELGISRMGLYKKLRKYGLGGNNE